MKKILSAVVMGLLLILSYLAGWHHQGRQATATASTRRVLYWVDPMHPAYKSDHPGVAPDCGMQLEPVYEGAVTTVTASGAPLPPGTVSIDQQRQQAFGIRIAPVEKASQGVLRALGRVVPEDTHVYTVNSGAEGFVRETYDDSVGVQIKKDQKLATCYEQDILQVASGYLAASEGMPGAAGKDGNRTLPYPGAVSKQGSSSLRGYMDRLRNLGMSDVQLKQIAENRRLPDSVDVVAPTDGFIVARSIVPGLHFERGTEFYRIADLSRVWILADIFGSEAEYFRPGTRARVTLPGQDKRFFAHVMNVLPQMDSSTRTLKLRLEAENPTFALRPDMFVDVELEAPGPTGLTVPVDAVIDSGRRQRVFVERSRGVFEPREVQTGRRLGDRVQIVHGLAEGERVVAEGTFLVDSESRLKNAAPSAHSSSPHKDDPVGSKSEHAISAAMEKVKDPACGMMVDSSKAATEGNTLSRDGTTYYFCSQSCKRKFSQQQEHYLALSPAGQRP
jgi:Cu(I)/Ag(I) efflux system membrane fusion protein